MQQEQWEFEYEQVFGEGYGSEAIRQTAKAAFHAGWDAALAAILERFTGVTQ